MKIKDKKKCVIIISIVIILIGLFGFTLRNEISEILSIESTQSTQYVDNPRTLKEWQEVNQNVVMVLEFNSNGILHNIPVLEVENGDKYMKRNPWGNYDTMGSVFMEKEISPFIGSNNWLINGHSSFNKDWNFTFLKNYSNKDYFNKHSIYQVEMEDGFHSFKIVSFAEYDYDLGEEQLYLGWYHNNFSIKEGISMFKETLPYTLVLSAGVEYQGQQIMTLITCNMKKKDSRYVLMAIELN